MRLIFYSDSEGNTMAIVIVEVGEREQKVLRKLVNHERRILHKQSALINRKEFERQGILTVGDRMLQETKFQGGL
jgi:hypothetical protein